MHILKLFKLVFNCPVWWTFYFGEQIKLLVQLFILNYLFSILFHIELGEKCNDTVYCDKDLFCDYGPNECIKLEVNCENAYCPPESELNCDKKRSYMVPKNGKDVCCSYCQPYASKFPFSSKINMVIFPPTIFKPL